MLALYISLGVVALLVLFIILGYNSLVRKKLKVDNAFSQIKIQCKKRFDLVPNLVETVKGYAKHEKETLENVIGARNAGASANSASELADANNQLTQTLGRLFALSEAYPDLKANANFSNLQNELVSIEKAIAVSRGFYNDAVMIYNRACLVFPFIIAAKLFNFKKADFFNAPDAETENVKVSF